MKKLSSISIFIFAVVVIAILVAGLLFYQNKKDNQIIDNSVNKNTIDNQVENTQTKTTTSTKSSTKTNSSSTTTNTQATNTLNMTEVAKHNNQNDCWLVIGGKIYDITSYFGRHPGGNGTMAATCGTDATVAYETKDPNATSAGMFSNGHSSRAESMLANYYVGDLK